jgi:hypothetical protein
MSGKLRETFLAGIFSFGRTNLERGIAESLWKRGPLKKATGILLGIVTKLVKKGQIRS